MAHPFRAWRENRQPALDRIEAVRLINEHRPKPTSPAYLQQIEDGHSRPSWDFAEDMSEATGGEVDTSEIMKYRRATDPARAASAPPDEKPAA